MTRKSSYITKSTFSDPGGAGLGGEGFGGGVSHLGGWLGLGGADGLLDRPSLRDCDAGGGTPGGARYGAASKEFTSPSAELTDAHMTRIERGQRKFGE